MLEPLSSDLQHSRLIPGRVCCSCIDFTSWRLVTKTDQPTAHYNSLTLNNRFPAPTVVCMIGPGHRFWLCVITSQKQCTLAWNDTEQLLGINWLLAAAAAERMSRYCAPILLSAVLPKHALHQCEQSKSRCVMLLLCLQAAKRRAKDPAKVKANLEQLETVLPNLIDLNKMKAADWVRLLPDVFFCACVSGALLHSHIVAMLPKHSSLVCLGHRPDEAILAARVLRPLVHKSMMSTCSLPFIRLQTRLTLQAGYARQGASCCTLCKPCSKNVRVQEILGQSAQHLTVLGGTILLCWTGIQQYCHNAVTLALLVQYTAAGQPSLMA